MTSQPNGPTTGSLEASDAAAAAVATAPRVTLESMNARIVEQHFLDGFDIASSAYRSSPMSAVSPALQALTICVLVLDNGFTIVGKSAPASAENFNRDLGRKFAREDAIRQMWPLEGYLLRDRLAKAVANV